MITEDKWDRAFDLTLPLISVGVGALSLALTIVSLRSQSLAQKVYHEGDQFLVSVRYPGQWLDIREFVQPDNPDVVAVCSRIGPDPWALYDFVCRNISYRRDIGEFWAFPSEVLSSGIADCEDTSNLLTSLLRCNGINAYTALGSYQGYGHAWTIQNGFIYETTYTQARLVPDPWNYEPMAMFHDQAVLELWPGAMGELFELARDEKLKLGLIARTLGAIGRRSR